MRIGDTEFPAGPPSYGSRTTASITPPARTAAWRVLQSLFREAALALNAAADDLIARDGRILVRDEPSRGMSFREAAARLRTDRISAVASRSDDYGGFRRRMGDAALAQQDLGGVQFAEVAVDTETGIVRVERVVAVQDCGRPMNPLQIESQVQGGVLMGLSYALFEDRILDQHTGRMVNPNLEQYKLAGPRETPAIDVVLLENYQGQQRDRRLWHRRARQHRHRPRDRQCRLQRDRRSPAQPADDAGGDPRRARQNSAEELTAMNRFAWASARTIAEAAAAASTTVADAMTTSPDAAGRSETSVVKAGGIDLLDLLKEDLLAPAKVVSLKEIPGLDADRRRARRRLAHRGDGHAGRARRSSRRAAALSRPGRCGAGLGEPADPQRRDLGRQSPAAAALLVFPGGGISLPEEGRRPLLRDLGREPVPRDLRQSALRHRPSFDGRHGAGRRWARRSSSRMPKAPCAGSCSRISSCRRTGTSSARTI